MIEVQGLTKTFGSETAVDHISFEVHPGDILGFLGPNGAGKTTTMRILTCYLPPTSGTVRIDGLDVLEDSLEIRKRIGYLPETTPLYPDMTVVDYLDFIADMRRIPSPLKTRRIAEMVEVCGLGDVLDKRIETLSKGYRQRVGLAQAIIHDPPILILDEPTSGLDPNQIVEIRELIRSLGREKTVILSTHILPEVQASCNRVLIIHRGRIVADATPEDLSSQFAGEQRILLGVKAPAETVQARLQALDDLHVASVSEEPDGVVLFTLTTSTDEDLRPQLFQLAVQEGWLLHELHRETANLEEIFRQLTTG